MPVRYGHGRHDETGLPQGRHRGAPSGLAIVTGSLAIRVKAQNQPTAAE
jgi:hypothetical protein